MTKQTLIIIYFCFFYNDLIFINLKFVVNKTETEENEKKIFWLHFEINFEYK